jgi:hypothetical protein
MVIKAFLFLVVVTGGAFAENKLAPTCGDLLAELHRKPRNLEFIRCTKETGAQGKPLKASYRVAGVHALEVEQYLIQNFHLPRLRKSCCQWDGKPGYYERGKDEFLIWMSGEDGATAAAATRAEWRKIPYFYIEVELPTESP